MERFYSILQERNGFIFVFGSKDGTAPFFVWLKGRGSTGSCSVSFVLWGPFVMHLHSSSLPFLLECSCRAAGRRGLRGHKASELPLEPAAELLAGTGSARPPGHGPPSCTARLPLRTTPRLPSCRRRVLRVPAALRCCLPPARARRGPALRCCGLRRTAASSALHC